MGQTTIEWTATHHEDGTVTPGYSFNPWWGCVKVSPGCANCYALTLSRRYGHDVWGPAKTTNRRMMSDNYWRQPLKWNAVAEKAGQRRRVFCASMADVFEEHPQVADARIRLLTLIDDTPWLDWLLLTKRPENIMEMMDDWVNPFPSNIWIGTSVENQEQADKRIPELLKVPAKVRFLSCEPLLGPVDLGQWIIPSCEPTSHVDWVIVGGESGPGARPMHPDWARNLRDQCVEAGVAYHFKQWGEYGPWPEEMPFNVRAKSFQWQRTEWGGEHWEARYENHYHLGKHAAGRLLDGREWNELPA